MLKMIKSGIFGLAIGDALGVPVEFDDRETLKQNPVTDMWGYGCHFQPKGTWSDDTSLTLCLMGSLSRGLDYTDLMTNFLAWMERGAFSPFGELVDIGNGTYAAITRFREGTPAEKCGSTSGRNNGNGSLMRILPLLFYLRTHYGKDFIQNTEAMNIVHRIAGLTHAHCRSQIACGIYLAIADKILDWNDLFTAVVTGTQQAFSYYNHYPQFSKQLPHYDRIKNHDFHLLPESQINSSGYMVDTLEAALWCLLNTITYDDCVLMAVNLGSDTDTVAAIAGGLAGLYYGYDSISPNWLSALQAKDLINNHCQQFHLSLN